MPEKLYSYKLIFMYNVSYDIENIMFVSNMAKFEFILNSFYTFFSQKTAGVKFHHNVEKRLG